MSVLSRDPVEVLALFRGGQLKPVQFRLHGRTYVVKTVDLAFSERKGRDKLLYFCVHDGTNTFRLAYSTDGSQWYMETEDALL